MILKSVHINRLDRGELENELSVRGSTDLEGLSMEEMRKILRKLLKNERSGASSLPLRTCRPEEVENCKEKLKDIGRMIGILSLPSEGTDVPRLKRKLEAVLCHMFQRIGRMGEDEDRIRLMEDHLKLVSQYEEITKSSLLDQTNEAEKSGSSDGSCGNRITQNARRDPTLDKELEEGVTRTRKTDLSNEEYINRSKVKSKKKLGKVNRRRLSSSTSTESEERPVKKILKKKISYRKEKKNRPIRTSPSVTSSDDCYSGSKQNIKLKATPVRFWNLKFSGDDNTSVGAFLADVEDRRVANNMSFRELVQAAGELFTGSALAVYRSCRGRIEDWHGLESET